jgi:hypothetical protein
MLKEDTMKKTTLVIMAALAAIGSHAAMASAGSGVTTSPKGAWVKPGYTVPANSEPVVKAGPAGSTSCQDGTAYTPVTWTTFDRWGSFPIARPANVAGEVRYCVSVRHVGAHAVKVEYDIIGQ